VFCRQTIVRRNYNTEPPKIEEPKIEEPQKAESPAAEKPIDKGPNNSSLFAIVGCLILGIGGYAAYVTYADPKEERDENNMTWQDHVYDKVDDLAQSVIDHLQPERKHRKLLPPPSLTPPYGRPYTLVIDLDCLMFTELTDTGRVTVKRPGVDFFLAALTPYFEIILVTNKDYTSVGGMVERIDQNRTARHALYKDSATKINGKFFFDLNRFERDLRRVVVLESSTVVLQDENSVILKPWRGELPDSDLLDMIPFFTEMVRRPDVYSYLQQVGREDIPKKYHARAEAARARQRIRPAVTADEPSPDDEPPKKGGGILGNIFK